MFGRALVEVQINETVFVWPGWIALALVGMCFVLGWRSKVGLVLCLLPPLAMCAWAWWIILTNLDHGHVLIRRAVHSILYGIRDGHSLSVKFWASNFAMAVAIGMAIGLSRRSPVVPPHEPDHTGSSETERSS